MEEAREQEVDRLLNSVSDEYLAKKKRTRIISYSCILAVVFALALVIIVLSCIKVDLRPTFIDKADSYNVTLKGNSNPELIDSSDDKFEKFNEVFQDSFKTQYLTALFTGRLGGYKINQDSELFYNKNNESQLSDTMKQKLTDNYVRVKFNSPQIVKKANGNTYYSKYDSQKQLIFNELYFNLSTTNSEGDLVLYIPATDKVARILTITVKANTYNLYKFLTE